MKLKEAIKVLSRYYPCPHENYDPNLGDGKTWAKCEACGDTFLQSNISRYKQNAEDFEKAIDCLQNILASRSLLEVYK